MKAQAILFTGVNQVALGAVQIPDLEADEVLVEAAYTCISPGTELRCLAGLQPDPAPYPYIPGYAGAGRVIAVGSNAGLAIGTRVFYGGSQKVDHAAMWGGHISHIIQPAAAVIPLPDDIDLRDAALARIAGISYHGLRLSHPAPHENVVVVGLGVIGLLSARMHALTGARVCALDISPQRVAVANQFGVEAFVPSSTLNETMRSIIPEGADVIVDATGSTRLFPQLVELAKDVPWDDTLTPGARFVIQGSYPGDVTLPYQDAFRKELTYLIPRDTQLRDSRAVLSLIQRGKLIVHDLISRTASPSDGQAVYAMLQAGEGLTAVFDWRAV